jgi:hypothetical protein
MRIGGDFEIDVSTLSQPCVDGFSPMPNLCKLWVDTGRSALLLSLQEIVRQGGVKKALLPAYICPSVIAPFVKSGFQLRFYNAARLADTPPPENGETILFAHYFGKKNFSAIEWIRSQQTKFQLFVIEDCVQASLNTNVGDVGDFVITSYRKFLPQPDGAILGSRREIRCDALDKPDEAFVSAKLVGKLLKHSNCEDGIFLKALGDAEDRLEMLLPRNISWLSAYMLQRTDVQKIARARRTNWLSLYTCLDKEGMLKSLNPLFDNLADGEVPLGFPVQISDGQRDRFRQFLAEKQIYCPVHWRLDHLDHLDKKYQEEVMLSNNILTLPIDQRLSQQHIEYMVKTIVSYFKRQTEITRRSSLDDSTK